MFGFGFLTIGGLVLFVRPVSDVHAAIEAEGPAPVNPPIVPVLRRKRARIAYLARPGFPAISPKAVRRIQASH